MKTAAVFAGIMLCAAGQLAAAPATNNTAERIVRWQEDLDCFALELPARHKDFYQLMPRDRFEREVAELKREVPQLSDAEVILRLSRMVASLGVAHTSIDITSIPGTMAFHSYPVQMQWFSDELAVVAAAPEYQAMLGSAWCGSGPRRHGKSKRRRLLTSPAKTTPICITSVRDT
jgi:hypothetical protein